MSAVLRTLPGVSRVSAGHLFIARCDVMRLRCDAWLLPSDDQGYVETPWFSTVGLTGPGHLTEWSDASDAVVRYWPTDRDSAGAPLLFIGAVGVPFGQVVDTPGWIDHVVSVATAFVTLASAAITEPGDGLTKRIALPVIGTGHAGLADDAGALLGPLVSALEQSAREHGVDVVLCVVDDLLWSAAQHVRALDEGHSSWDLPRHLIDLAHDLASHVRDGHLVLFLGAGISADAGLPSWTSLLRDIGTRLGIDDAQLEQVLSLDPRDAAAWLRRRADNPSALNELVRELLSTDRFGLTHALLASLRVEAAVTTNFDDLYEAACALPGAAAPARLPYDPASTDRPWLLKLHGDLEHDDLVFTRAEYLGAERNRAALFGIVQAMLVTRHLLFVGYSLSDEDFHRLVDQIGAALQGAHRPHLGTVLAVDDGVWHELWDDSLDIVVTGTDDAASNARTLLILLDLVNHIAADKSQFLLDNAYDQLLSEPERNVRQGLLDVQALLGQLPPDSSVRTSVERMLTQFGADQPRR